MTRRHHDLRHLRTLALAAGLALAAACSPTGDDEPAGDAAASGETEENAAPQTAAAPPPAASSDRLGYLTVRLDGESTTFETRPDLGRDRPATAVVRAMGPVSQVQLQALLPGDPMKQASLDATLMYRDGAFHPTGEPELHVFPEGTGGPGLMSTSLEVTWDRLEADPEGGHVAGSFTGTVCELQGALLSEEGCMPVAGEFDSELRPSQF